MESDNFPQENACLSRRPLLKWLLRAGLVFVVFVCAVVLMDPLLRQLVFGPKFGGIPLVEWQRFFVDSRVGKERAKATWWRSAREVFLYESPEEVHWRRLSAEERRDIVLSLDRTQPDSVRLGIIRVLHGAPSSLEVTSRLREFVNDPNPSIRLDAAKALYTHEPHATDFVTELVIVMEDSRGFVSDDVVFLLANIGKQVPEVVLSPMLSRISPDGKVSHAALLVLSNMGPLAQQASPQLLENSYSGDWKVRALSIRALGNVGAKEAIPRIRLALKDGNKNVEAAAGHALQKLGVDP